MEFVAGVCLGRHVMLRPRQRGPACSHLDLVDETPTTPPGAHNGEQAKPLERQLVALRMINVAMWLGTTEVKGGGSIPLLVCNRHWVQGSLLATMSRSLPLTRTVMPRPCFTRS
jgi:hypothetical protein